MTLRSTLAAATIACLALAPTYAGEPLDTYTELAKCSGVTDNTERLACYDKLMPRVRAALANGAGELSHEDQSSLFGLNLSGIFGSSEPTSPQQFGANDLPEGQAPAPGQPTLPRAIDHIDAAVTDVAFNPFGKFVVFLDSGQVWKQQQSDTGTARIKVGDHITIEKASLGSYQLTVNGGMHTYRVNRVK